ncbi:hypothetical protein SNE23_29285 (plasmid) [Bacillus sp. RA(2023)]|nr:MULTISPECIES: hypothetical protein [Bacillus]WPU78104.1 hypothetical protein SNE23_29285 [Bacillus sp. RA(2023)]
MGFLFELLKESERAIKREYSTYVLRKQVYKRIAENPSFAVVRSSIGLKSKSIVKILLIIASCLF